MKTQEKNNHDFIKLTVRSKKSKKRWNGIPAFYKRAETGNSIYKHLLLSIFNHIIFFLIIWSLAGILKTHIINPLFEQKDKINDIEFAINNSAGSRKKHKKASADKNIQTNTVGKNTETDKISKSNFTKSKSFESAADIDEFSIPIPKTKSSQSSAGGLSRHSGKNSSEHSNDLNPSYMGTEDGSANGTGPSKGSGFDKNAARKTISTYDISPYVNELKRNIRMNWKPAKTSEGKYVELFLRIAKDGRLIILNVKKTSESGDVDEAALNAVRKTLPLNPLPTKYAKSFLDLIFTFDSSSSSVGSRF